MPQAYQLLLLLASALGLFIWGRWRYDVVALFVLMAAVVLGLVPSAEAFYGFANPAVVTVVCIMVLGQAVQRSGILGELVKHVIPETKYFIPQLLILLFLTLVLSAFMNNVGALALMMPIATKMALDAKRSPSLVLMPLAFSSALGGLTTMIGTPPNILISAYREELLGQPYHMFDFTPVGLVLGIVGVLFVGLIGWRFLPARRDASPPIEDFFQIKDYITEVRLLEDSPLIDKTIRELDAFLKEDFVIAGLIHKGRKRLAISGGEVLEADDILIVEIAPSDLEQLLQKGKLEIVSAKEPSSELLSSKETSLLEAVVPPGAQAEKRSAQSMQLRYRHGINLLGISRQGSALHKRLSSVPLRAGDVVLMQGSTHFLRERVVKLGLLPLAERGLAIGAGKNRWLPLLFFICAIVVTTLTSLTLPIALSCAAIGLILTRVIPLSQIYDSIEWPVIVLLGAMIPLGFAMQSTGGTEIIAAGITKLTGLHSPLSAMILILVVTIVLSDLMNNAATAVVMAPIAATVASDLMVNPDPFLMTVAVGASCAFLTPIGHQNNTLIMGPGGYRFTDYPRLGLPVDLLIVLITPFLMRFIWPF